MSEQKKLPTNVQEFQQKAGNIALRLLTTWVGEQRAKEATGRIGVALAASVASARDPSDFYECTSTSIAACIAISALTGIMPGTGATALAYVVPQRARKGEPPQLQYSLSHRGINALARRCGQTMLATPIGTSDEIKVCADGEVDIVRLNSDQPPQEWDDLRGVVIAVKELSSGLVVQRGWVPRVLIERRRRMSRSFNSTAKDYSPWVKWPIEMAIKTAMHYAIGRGWVVIDDTEAARALNTDIELDADHGPREFPDATASLNSRLAARASDVGGEPEGAKGTINPEADPTTESERQRIAETEAVQVSAGGPGEAGTRRSAMF